MPHDVVDVLKTAASNLLYPSESDEPFEVLDWKQQEGAISVDLVRQLSGNDNKVPVKQVEFADFCAELDETDDAPQFKKWKATVEKNLSNIQVFRFGEVRIAIYVVGQTKDSRWIAIRTISIET